jgi:hypothetical protein
VDSSVPSVAPRSTSFQVSTHNVPPAPPENSRPCGLRAEEGIVDVACLFLSGVRRSRDAVREGHQSTGCWPPSADRAHIGQSRRKRAPAAEGFWTSDPLQFWTSSRMFVSVESMKPASRRINGVR